MVHKGMVQSRQCTAQCVGVVQREKVVSGHVWHVQLHEDDMFGTRSQLDPAPHPAPQPVSQHTLYTLRLTPPVPHHTRTSHQIPCTTHYVTALATEQHTAQMVCALLAYPSSDLTGVHKPRMSQTCAAPASSVDEVWTSQQSDSTATVQQPTTTIQQQC